MRSLPSSARLAVRACRTRLAVVYLDDLQPEVTVGDRTSVARRAVDSRAETSGSNGRNFHQPN